MADANVTTTTAAAYLATRIADVALSYFEKDLRIGSFCTDYSSLAVPGAKAIQVPLLTEESAATKSADTAVEYTTNTDSSATISFNQYIYVAKRIEDIAQIQSNEDLIEAYGKSAAYACLKQFEAYLAGIIQSATTNDVTLGTDNTITYAKYLEAQTALNVDGVKVRDCAFGVSPELYATLAALTEFKASEVRGEGPGILSTGADGVMLGAPVYVSDDWDGDGGTGDESATLWHPKSVGFAIQKALTVDVQWDVNHQAWSMVVSMIFGSSLLVDKGVANFNNP